MGPLERAVRKDLRWLGDAVQGRATMEQIALSLARAIDARGGEGPTTTAKLLQELRLVMGQVMKVDSDNDDAAQLAAEVSTPVRHAPDPGPGDVGSGRGGDSPPAG